MIREGYKRINTTEEAERIVEKNENDLIKFMLTKSHKTMTKLHHYFEVYDRHFSKYRGRKITIVEVGVQDGGSLQMWRDYFGCDARIIGIDINPECRKLETEGFDIYIGSQDDREFWKAFKKQISSIDIFIDDGGHTMEQQNITFEEIFDTISEDGVYLCEDLHTSYWAEFGGGYKNESSFIERSKNLIDDINAYKLQVPQLPVSRYTEQIAGIHYYNSICVIEKKKMREPVIFCLDTEEEIRIKHFLQKNEITYLFGCGSIAEGKLKRYQVLREKIKGIIVSDGEQKAEKLCEIPIQFLSQICAGGGVKENSIGAVVAVRERFRQEIVSKLEEQGIAVLLLE